MRTLKYLIIPAALIAGVFAVQTAQAQSYSYSKTGYAPAPAGSIVTFSYGGNAHVAAANTHQAYTKTGYAAQPTYAPHVQYAAPAVSAGYGSAHVSGHGHRYSMQDSTTYAEQAQSILSYQGQIAAADQMQGYGSNVMVVHDTSGLPGYGVPSARPMGYDAPAYSAEGFPEVYARPGSASYIMQAVSRGQ